MKRWDHLDVVVTVGICATILGAGIFFFAFGGAPYGLLASQSVEMAVDPQGIAQDAMGRAIVQDGHLRYFAESTWGTGQEALGGALLAAFQGRHAQVALIPGLRAEAHQSLVRMQGRIQETAGRSVVQATQRMWREGTTETAQLRFIEGLGRIKAGMILHEQAATSLREEALGWNVVGGYLAMDRYQGQIQEQLGSAIRNTGVMASKIGTETPLAQEGLGGAVLVAARSAEQSRASSMAAPVVLAGGARTGEVPYQAGVILLAAFFVGIWGFLSVAQSGAGLPTYGTSRPAQDQYRKAG